eukprot:TRINITY_DN3806_c0_g1_i2.p1 TRINITY_DN3806_c0_g1~~TRINITY_DN3806_c0_g1_i2.p1  ORF type:complete len:606 (+),score=98.43 TRINITY_DN3806_c0_g1_i2:3-1820(+)
MSFWVLVLLGTAQALDNGVARTPPMGFNSYMAGVSGEAGLGRIASFLVASGLRDSGYTYVNTDEGWEDPNRDPTTGRLRWSVSAYPSGLPRFISKLHAMGLKFGIYGASSGVTCGESPGQLYHEQLDADTYAGWGVDYLKSDNCASYALDPSVRFGAMRDALNRTGRRIVLSVEPFSISPDPEQSYKVANLWRTGCDIARDWGAILDRADIADKWAPLAGPGGWNDPDMIHLQNPNLSPNSSSSGGLSLNENRAYFGLWALMKSPLLLSSNLSALDPGVIAIANNSAVIAINQDSLGVQARKLAVDGTPIGWLVGLKDCATQAQQFHSRGFGAGTDPRGWELVHVAKDASNQTAYTIRSRATGRCLAVSGSPNSDTVLLLPCSQSSAQQLWRFDKGATTVTSITNLQTGMALAVSNGTLRSASHSPDLAPIQVPDSAYGLSGLVMAPPYDQNSCSTRDCQNYDPSQMWYYSPSDGLLRASTYVASINHHLNGDGYVLTPKAPTYQHHCLAHVLSTSNFGTVSGSLEVWGGPLSGGAWVVGCLNRGSVSAACSMGFELLELADASSRRFAVLNLWSGGDLGSHVGSFEVVVASHDLQIFKLTPLSL